MSHFAKCNFQQINALSKTVYFLLLYIIYSPMYHQMYSKHKILYNIGKKTINKQKTNWCMFMCIRKTVEMIKWNFHSKAVRINFNYSLFYSCYVFQANKKSNLQTSFLWLVHNSIQHFGMSLVVDIFISMCISIKFDYTTHLNK